MVCPDPVVFQRWQAATTQTGIALLVALALCVAPLGRAARRRELMKSLNAPR